MRKRKIKHYLKTGILLFGISLLLWNCEKEDTEIIQEDSEIIQSESNSDLKIEIVNLKQIESNSIVSNKLNKIIAKSSNKVSSYAAKNIYNAAYNFTVNTDYVKYIENGDYHSYNFPITRDNPVNDNIDNLLLSLNKEGGYDAYIVQYNVAKESFANLNLEEFNKINIHFTPINFDSSSLLAARLSFECVQDHYLYCPLGGGHTEGFDDSCELEIAVTSTCGWVDSGGGSGGTPTGSETNNDGTTDTSGGTGGTSSTNGDNPIISTPTVDEFLDFYSTLSFIQKKWCDANFDLINSFLIQNNYSTDAYNFAEIAIDAIVLENAEVDWVNKIINNLTGKALCVYNKLEGNDLMNKTIKRFNNSNFVDVELKYGTMQTPSASGETQYGSPLTITLNQNHIENIPSLLTALVILHEAIHAELNRQIFITGGLMYTPPNTYTLNGTKADFPTLFDYYNDYPDNPHHNLMSDYYRNALEQGLRDYAESIGKTFPDQLFKDLAWGGLQGTKAWDNMFLDPVFTASEQIRINNTINNFKNSGTNECQ